MDSFSLLKYWRGNVGAAAAIASAKAATAASQTTPITTIASDDLPPADEVDSGDSTSDGGDEGPFFDLEFAMPGDVDVEAADSGSDNEDDMAAELDLVGAGDSLQSGSVSLSPSNELFFKGKLVAVETSSAVVLSDGDSNKHQLAATLLKSATKFRVFLLGFKKPKSNANAATAEEKDGVDAPQPSTPKQQQLQQSNKNFFIKFKFEEVPFVSLFTRDNSSRISTTGGLKLDSDEPTAAEKKLAKEMMQKYINKIKPLYIKVSKTYAEKLRISGLLNSGENISKLGTVPEKKTVTESAKPPQTATVRAATETTTSVLPAGLKVVRKKLGKSKSASSAVAAAPPQQRRNDTLLQQQDGIQSAIAHCKRSFIAAKGSESPLMRSMSGPMRPMSGGAGGDGQD